MSSQQVDVEVTSGDRRVDGPLLRPVRLMPSGRAGVVYGGAVYPLHSGNRIDLTEEAADKFECPSFLPPGAAIPYAPSRVVRRGTTVAARVLLPEDNWYLESNRFGHYLVFDADETAAERVVDALDEGPLGVRRWDASHRPADNGRLYDWFVRLLFDGDREECLHHLRSVLTPQSRVEPAFALDDAIPEQLRSTIVAALQKALAVAQDNSRLTEQVANLQARLADIELSRETEIAGFIGERDALEARAGAQAAHIDALTAAAADREKDHDRALEQLVEAHTAQRRRLEAEVRALRTSAPQADSAQVETLREQLDEQLRDLDQLYESLEAEMSKSSRLESQLMSVTAAHAAVAGSEASLKQSLQSTEARLAEMANEHRERRTADREKSRSKVRPNLERFLGKLLRRCELDRESVYTLLEFERPAKAVRELLRIDDDDPQLRSVIKPVQGYDQWWELSKVHTGASGKSAMGRIYYRPHADGVRVVVHRKKDNDEQRRFMERRLTTT